MNGSQNGPNAIPAPRDDDDGDVAWALATAQVQWAREAYADALVWLRRAIDAAVQVARVERARELEAIADGVQERMLHEAERRSTPGAAPAQLSADGVDELIGVVPESPGAEEAQDTTLLAEYAPDSVAAAQAELEAAEAAASRVEVVGAESRTRAQQNRADAATNPFLADADVHSDAFSSAVPESPRGRSVEADDAVVDGAGNAPSDDHDSVTMPLKAPVRASPVPGPPPPPSGEPKDAVPRSGMAPVESVRSEPARVGSVALDEVAGLQDLPEDAQALLAESANLEIIDAEQEVSGFAVALVVSGWVNVMPAVDEVSAAVLQAGDVVFTNGSLEEGVALRVVAGEGKTVIAVWDHETFGRAVADCPWVADDLRLVADRYQALAGATMGLVGERLDDSLRGIVNAKLEVRALRSGDVLVAEGSEVHGILIVGAGRLEIIENAGGDERVAAELGPGEFVFPERLLDHRAAAFTARAGPGGALVLAAEPMDTQELLTSVPPLLEILAC